MKKKPTLFDFVRIIDETHLHFGKTGQITDYDTMEKEFILHFDRLTDNGNIFWVMDSTRVLLRQLEVISKHELEKWDIPKLSKG